MGCLHTDMFSDVDNSDLIVVWGTDPSTSTPPEMFQRIKTAAEEGAEIIVIDPRKTAAADLPGSEWIPIRPGSDGALALGLAHILIRDNRYDRDFAEEWTVGFEEFAEYVRAFTPQYVSRLTGIDAQRIERLARSVAEAEGASYVMYTGLEYTKSGVQNIRAVMVFWALAGQLDVEGGRCFARRENRIALCRDRQLGTPGYDQSIGSGKFPVYAHFCGGEPHASLLPHAIIDGDPYKIRALLICGASLITSWPNPELWRKALGELDFLVTMDLQLTADAAYADIVLPVTTGFEQASYCYYGSALRYREKMIDPVGEARSDYDILVELAKRLGYGHLYLHKREALIEEILRGSGFTANDVMQADKQVIKSAPVPMAYKKWEKGLLRKDGQPGFETPSGKFEIKSTVLEQYGYRGIPEFEESAETAFSDPQLAEKYPLILGTGPFKPDMKSCLRAIPSFIEKYPHPVVQINTEDARQRGIAMGDKVSIKTARGSVLMRAHVTDRIMPGFAYAQVGGGGPQGPEEWREANVNMLTDMAQYDEISGFPVYKTLLCQITKKKRARRGIAVQDPSLGCVG
jgi:anaerobic selenocysteine-containing dehydrogenase